MAERWDGQKGEQLSLAIEYAPDRVRAHGLSEAHSRPLVGEKDFSGQIYSFRSSPEKAWGYPYLEFTRSATAYTAVVIDADDAERAEEIIYQEGGIMPNWFTTNLETGHGQAAYTLKKPVLRYPGSSSKPIEYLAHVERELIAAWNGDPSFTGVLARNPIPPPGAKTCTQWFRLWPWTLEELDEAASVELPKGGRAAKAADGAVGRNCALFDGLMKWAGYEANRFQSVNQQAYEINSGFTTPLPLCEVKATAKSVEKHRRNWEGRPEGWHSFKFRKRQSWKGTRAGLARRAKNADRDRAIAEAYANGIPQADIAQEWGISQPRISQILKG